MEKIVRNVTERTAREQINQTHSGKVFTEPSLTVEGLSEPMSTILERFQRGQQILGSKIYYDSENNDQFEAEQPFSPKEYDLSDIDKARDDVERYHMEAEDNRRKVLKQKQDEADEKRALEIIEKKELEKQKKEQQNQHVKTKESQEEH